MSALATSYQLLATALTGVHFPVSFALVAELEQAVPGIMSLSAIGADQKPAPLATLAVEVLGNREAHSTATGNQEDSHSRRRVWLLYFQNGARSKIRSVTLEIIKTIVQALSSIAGIIAAFWALWVYRSNSRRERARWAESLYARFYERSELKALRDQLDCAPGEPLIASLVAAEPSTLTDYLNFFEFVAYLQSSKQLSYSDVQAMFGYYLECLRRHKEVVEYIYNKEKGFEYLRKILSHV